MHTYSSTYTLFSFDCLLYSCFKDLLYTIQLFYLGVRACIYVCASVCVYEV